MTNFENSNHLKNVQEIDFFVNTRLGALKAQRMEAKKPSRGLKKCL